MLKNGCRDRVQFTLFGRRLEDEFGNFIRVCWAKLYRKDGGVTDG